MGNKEPIIVKYDPVSFVNAVGLANPGVEEFVKKIKKIKIPSNKFLLISIFGNNEYEFKKISQRLCEFADGFELNISCPHSDKYGQVVGQDLKLVEKIIKSVACLKKPIFIKLSPNLNIKEIIHVALKNGVAGITAINTKGPKNILYDNYPVLSNKVGGVSGKAILKLGLRCVKKVREISSGLLIIGCGGISTAKNISDYKKAGANFFGIGSALAGMNTEEMKGYFNALSNDLGSRTNDAKSFLKNKLNMDYSEYKIEEKINLSDEAFLLRLNKSISIKPGQFIFTWLPEKGEKPFSVFDDNPFTLLIRKRGCFTNELSKLKRGDSLYIRGPYGNSPDVKRKVLLVGGGTGIAPLYLFAKYNNATVILGAKNKGFLPCFKKFKTICKNYYLYSENGEVGSKGKITDDLEEIIKKIRPDYCINCGPEIMVNAAIQKEIKYLNSENIFSSIEFITKCGIGLCGSCATSKGYRSCVDGTFLKKSQI
jgi:dihydroorotate dehydrogenase (NAD+) catalytic subunit